MPTKVRIRRSSATAAPTSLDSGELAYSSINDILFIGSPASGTPVTPIGGKRFPGTLTANQALVANSTSGIDKVIVANLVATAIHANGSFGTAGFVLVTPGDGSNVYWQSASAVGGVNTAFAYTFSNTISFTANVTVNTIFTTGTGTGTGGLFGNSTTMYVGNSLINTSITSAGLTVNGAFVVNSTALTTGGTGLGTGGLLGNSTNILVGNNTLNSTLTSSLLSIANSTGNVQATATSIRVANSTAATFTVNTTQITIGATPISANGGVGSAGQVLTSAGAGNVYWSTPQVGDITSVAAGNGLTGGGTSGDVTLDVGAGNGITVAADSVAVLANSGIVSNSTGVWVLANTSQGLIANSSGVHAKIGTGLVYDVSGNLAINSTAHVDHTTVSITAGNGLTGGGTIAATRTLDVGAGNGIAVAADSVAVLANSGIVSNSTGVFVLANNGIVSNSTGVFVLANTSSGLVANATGVHAKVSSTVVLDGTGNLAVNSAALSFQDLTVSGNLTVLGDLVSLNVATLSVEDSLITLAKDQGSTSTPTDALDIGLFGIYGNTANLWYTGLFRDQSDSGIWKLFQSNGVVSNTNVDTANTSAFSLARLQTYLISSGLTTNLTHVAVTANSTVNVTITANSLTLATALAATSGGTGQSTYAVGDLLVGGATNTLTKLTLGADGKVLQSLNGTSLVYDDIDGGVF